MLEKDLLKPGVMEFLRKYGYENSNSGDCLIRLKNRFEESDSFLMKLDYFWIILCRM